MKEFLQLYYNNYETHSKWFCSPQYLRSDIRTIHVPLYFCLCGHSTVSDIIYGKENELKMSIKDINTAGTSNLPEFKRNIHPATIVIPLAMYILFSLSRNLAAGSDGLITIGALSFAPASLTSAFSLLGSICLVVIVLYYKRFGFIVSMLCMAVQFPRLLVWVVLQNNSSGLPGIFTNIFTIIMLVIIHLKNSHMEKSRKSMQKLFEQTASSLVNAIDAKDTYTHGHSSRVAEYSLRLAEIKGMSTKECEEVYYTALLHDVGKIGVPSSIINKPGKLTKEEYDIIKQHPILGSQILETIKEHPFLTIGAHYHHERYDGKGYPEGLKGEEIPENARIIAVADAYDAMTSIRSYRDPIPQDKVREEIVKGIGTQFDPEYARLMLHLIDVDTEYEMKERAKTNDTDEDKVLTVGEHRSSVHDGILITPCMAAIHLTVSSDGNADGKAPVPSMILFDSLDGIVHFDEKHVQDLLYYEYGEIWFDGRTQNSGARKIQTTFKNVGSSDIKTDGEYKIEAVRIKDHALIRIFSRKKTVEVITALPDSSRYMYIGFTGEHCCIRSLNSVKAKDKCSEDHIPRIAEKVSYIDHPSGDIPNVQIDSFRSASSKGIKIRDGLRITFHTKNLPSARLVWHCPFIDIFCSDDGTVHGKNYRDLAFMRFDGEFWAYDSACSVELNVSKTDDFEGWDAWKEHNREGFDAVVTFMVEHHNITMVTENAGISVISTATVNGVYKPVYAAITGDQIAVTNIHIS